MGSIVGYGNISAATRNFRAIFMNQLEQSSGELNALIGKLAMVVSSTDAIEQYNWLGASPGLSEWIGDRKLQRLSAESYAITNKDWANGLVVHANDFADDKLSMVAPRVQALADAVVRHKKNLLKNLVINGFSATGYDAVAFFSNSHPNNGGTAQDNLETGSLSATTFQAACKSLMGRVDEEGENLDLMPTDLIVGESNYFVAKEITQSAIVASSSVGVSNVNIGLTNVIVLKGLGTKWAVADLSKPIKPFILQNREPEQFDALDQGNDLPVFMRKEFLFGASWRGNAGYGFWQTIVGSAG